MSEPYILPTQGLMPGLSGAENAGGEPAIPAGTPYRRNGDHLVRCQCHRSF
ncbi:hypothetical protein AB0M97_03350 [Streptomyces sp. NPDC051207]|uniref:hypothetical protein n=1 Tax=Streptomyces sp. NPDC051207 TaxID=3154641 RepID=UPI00342A6136